MCGNYILSPDQVHCYEMMKLQSTSLSVCDILFYFVFRVSVGRGDGVEFQLSSLGLVNPD